MIIKNPHGQNLDIDLMWFRETHSIHFNEFEVGQLASVILFSKCRYNLSDSCCFTSARDSRDIHTSSHKKKHGQVPAIYINRSIREIEINQIFNVLAMCLNDSHSSRFVVLFHRVDLSFLQSSSSSRYVYSTMHSNVWEPVLIHYQGIDSFPIYFLNDVFSCFQIASDDNVPDAILLCYS